MRLVLARIPFVAEEWESAHRVRALVLNGKSPVMETLANWQRSEPGDFKKIVKVMERVARLPAVADEKHVKQDRNKSGIWEIRAHRGHARVLFAYDRDEWRTAICLHTYWKGSGNQEHAFALAARMWELWLESKVTKE